LTAGSESGGSKPGSNNMQTVCQKAVIQRANMPGRQKVRGKTGSC